MKTRPAGAELPACPVTTMKIPGRTRDDYFRRQRLSRRHTGVSCRRFCSTILTAAPYAEHTLRRNVGDLSDVALRQRILRNMSDLSLETTLFNEAGDADGVGAGRAVRDVRPPRRSAGRRRGGRQRHSVHPLYRFRLPDRRVAPTIKRPMWFQLYVLRDRGFMRNALERAKAAGCSTLVFTVDMPTPGARYRDAHSGMSGPNAALRRYWQAVTHPQWAWDVGLNGRPHDLGNISRLSRQTDRA